MHNNNNNSDSNRWGSVGRTAMLASAITLGVYSAYLWGQHYRSQNAKHGKKRHTQRRRQHQHPQQQQQESQLQQQQQQQHNRANIARTVDNQQHPMMSNETTNRNVSNRDEDRLYGNSLGRGINNYQHRMQRRQEQSNVGNNGRSWNNNNSSNNNRQAYRNAPVSFPSLDVN